MAAAVADDFSAWLGNKLKDLNTDESVFGSYISGILDSDETTDEKNDALQGILAEIVENASDINEICNEILEMWVKCNPEAPQQKLASDVVDAKLAKLLESQSLATTKQKEYTEEEKKIREAILSQYSEMTDEEEEEDEGIQSGGDHKETGLEKNTNASTVMQAEKLKREQAKLDSQKKKDKDKEDREKQKQLKEDKKEKRKTQKGERKR